MTSKKPMKGPIQWNCNFCEEIFKSEKKLCEHAMNFHEVDKPFLCEICTQTFKSLHNLKAHVASVHGLSMLLKLLHYFSICWSIVRVARAPNISTAKIVKIYVCLLQLELSSSLFSAAKLAQF